jgi:uncharacterized membrane protein HdeD (DUF308 family)
MRNMLTGSWLAVLLRGLIAIGFGLFAIFNASGTALILLSIFVIYAVADGLFTIFMAVTHRADSERWWLAVLYGVVSVLFGVFTLLWPEITALLLLYIIAARVVIGGFFEIGLALKLGEHVKGEWLMVVVGIVSIIFGSWMFLQPLIGGLSLLWVIGIYAIIVGGLLVIQAFRIKHKQQPTAI